MHGRSALALLIFTILFSASVVAGAATVKHKSAAKPHAAPSGTTRAATIALINKFKRLQRGPATLGKQAIASAKVKNGIFTEDVPYAAAVDGQFLYVGHMILKARVGHGKSEDNGLLSFRTRLVRKDRVSNAEVELFNQKDAIPLSLFARGGRVGFQVATFKESKDDIKTTSKIYSGSGGDAALAPTDAGSAEIGDFSVCGVFKLLAGLSDTGELLVAKVDASCISEDNNFVTSLAMQKLDGTTRDLGDLYTGSALDSSLVLTGDTLIEPNPFETATSARSIETGALKDLWSPGARLADVGPDGTIALIGRPFPQQYVYYDEYETVDVTLPSAKHAKTSVPPSAGNNLPFPIPTPKRPKYKFPFVIFPGGDADSPALISASRGKVYGLKYCGTNLYLLEADVHGTGEPDSDEYSVLDGSIYTDEQFARFDIQLYTAQGQLVRSLGKTKTIGLTSTGCNGDRLVVAARERSGSLSAFEAGP